MYQTLIAIEYVTRTFFNQSSVDNDKMDCQKATEASMDASDVQFHWALASSQMNEELSELILERIVTK